LGVKQAIDFSTSLPNNCGISPKPELVIVF